MPIKDFDSLLPLPRQSEQLNLLAKAPTTGSSGHVEKREITSHLLATRAPTPMQRDSMLKQSLAMNLIQQYTKLIVCDEVRFIMFPIESALALREITNFNPKLMMETKSNLEKLAEAGAFDEEDIRELLDALIPRIYSTVAVEVTPRLTSDQLRIISRGRNEMDPTLPTFKSEHLVNLDITFEQSLMTTESRAIRAVLTNLYCLDLNRILHTPGKQGVVIPRFIHGYPSRAMNEALIGLYSGELMIMRRLISEDLEVSQITRELMRAKAAEMANEIRP